MKNKKSLIIFLLACGMLTLTKFWYSQRCNDEQEITWDVASYYYYLPSVFIYNDLKYLNWQEEIVRKYDLTFDHSLMEMKLDDGSRVIQYTYGMSLLYCPLFLIAHFLAPLFGYAQDGFSTPYQYAVGIGTLLYSLLGLFFLRKLLFNFFSDSSVALTLFAISIGTNYFEHASISSPMTHGSLFTIYVLLIWYSLNFWKTPVPKNALLIGLFAGLGTLIRPTEIILFLIPLLIGVSSFKNFTVRLKFLFQKKLLFVFSLIPVLVLGFVQMCYWKYVSGHWFFYSYGDQKFDWLHPHVSDGWFSVRAGWLFYSPIMIFSLLGFYFLYKNYKDFFFGFFTYFILFSYICLSWHLWAYSGAFGNRAMIQSYALLAFPFCSFNEWVLKKKWTTIIFSLLIIFFTYYNLWLTHQAHKGGLLSVFGINQTYFSKIFLRYNVPIETRYFLDCSERFDGAPKNCKTIFSSDFENDSLSSNKFIKALNGNHSLFIDKENSYFYTIKLKLPDGSYDWARVSFLCGLKWKEYVDWNMTQCWLKFFANGKDVKDNFVCVQHLVKEYETKRIHLDMKFPDEKCDSLQMFFYKGNSLNPVAIDDLKIEVFNE